MPKESILKNIEGVGNVKVLVTYSESSKTVAMYNEDSTKNDTEEEDKQVRLEKLVNSIIASMTDTCKNILHGYYWNDYSTSTIADIFNFSDANSVKAQKYKCVKKFREKYNELKGKIYG